MGLLVIAQTWFSIMLILVPRARCFVVFVVIVAVMKMVIASHAVCATLISRDIFKEKNSYMTFGIDGGLALGIDIEKMQRSFFRY